MSFIEFNEDGEAVRQAMRRWATGVTIVTSHYGGVSHGMTVSSFTSIALSPPLLLVSLQDITRTYELVKKSGIFGVTILDHTQQDLSDRFAGRIPELEDRFRGLETFTLSTGAPFLPGGMAYFDCKVLSHHTFGDHALFVGNVVEVKVEQADRPLLYYNQTYWNLDGKI
jgi:flavin reductase